MSDEEEYARPATSQDLKSKVKMRNLVGNFSLGRMC
jgi:hypothetical protein